jgi:lysophospholipase L1-like esterase
VLCFVAWPLGLLAGTELALRVVFPDKTRRSIDEALRPDSVYLYGLKPRTRGVFDRSEANGGDVILWQTNAEGFRGGPLERDPDARVVVFGDSNVQAVFSSLENTFVHRLGTGLSRATGRDVEVINAGIVGYGPDQSLLRFREVARSLRPDLVVIHVFADNDFGDLVRNRLFRVVQGRLERHPHPHRVHQPGLLVRLQGFANSLLVVKAARHLLKRAGIELTAKSAAPAVPTDLSRYVSELVSRIEQEQAVYAGLAPDTLGQADHYDLDVATDPESPTARVKIELMEAVLRQFKVEADRMGIKVLAVIEPSAVDLTSNLLLTHRYLAGRFVTYTPERLSSVLEGICRRNAIPHVNLFPVFQKGNPDALYFRDTDNHWNDQGQRLAADTVAPVVASMLPRTRTRPR